MSNLNPNLNSSPNTNPKDQTLFAKLVTYCLRTSCKCSPEAPANLDPRHDPTCPYTPNCSFTTVDEYRRLKVRTFLNTIIAITPTPTPIPITEGQSSDITARQEHENIPSKTKQVTFHASVTKPEPQAPVKENPAPSSTTADNSGANTSPGPQERPLLQHIMPEIIEHLILCNKTHVHLHFPCPICTFTAPEWTTYLDNLRLRPNENPIPHPNPSLTSTTTWIPLLHAVSRAVKLWISQTILSLSGGGWDSSLPTAIPTPIPTSSSKVKIKIQIPYAFIAHREQIHLSHALSTLASSHLTSARAISHALRKLRAEISRVAYHAEKIIRLEGIRHNHQLRTELGLGLGVSLGELTQPEGHDFSVSGSFQGGGIVPEIDASKGRYLAARKKVLLELKRSCAEIGGFRSQLERHLDISEPNSDEPEPEPETLTHPGDASENGGDGGQPQARFEISGPPISTIRTALHELDRFAGYWPTNSRRKVDLVYKLLGLVHQDVLKLEQDIEAMKSLWTNGPLIGLGSGLEDTRVLLGLVIWPSGDTVGRWCDGARVSLALALTGEVP